MADTVEETHYFEDYLKTTGWGLYYNFIIGLACACSFIQGVTFVTIPLAVALSSCDQNFIAENIILRIFTSFYLGSSVGGLIANFLSDRYGRKRYLSYSLMLIFLSTFTAAFAYNAYVIIGAALVLGVGMETNLASLKLLTIEVLPKEKRGFCMIFSSLYWVLGYIITSVLTIMFETSTILNISPSPDLNLTTWRIMFAACGGLNILLACACALIEESPRYFLQMGRSYLAFLVLKQLYAINKSDFAENFKVKEEEIKHLISHYDLYYLEPEPYWDIFKKLIWRFNRSLKIIFSKRFYQVTGILIMLKIPVLVVGLLQLNIFLAKQMTVTALPNISRSKYKGLDFIYPVFKPISYMSKEQMHKSSSMCSANKDNAAFYKFYLILGCAMVPGLVFSMIVVDKLGRRFILFSSLLISSCSFLILRFIEESTLQLILLFVILMSMSNVTSTLSLVSLEAYPTALRGTSCGVTNFFGLFLAMFFINFISINRPNFAVTMGILYFCMSIFTLFLPELKEKPMVE